MSSLARSKHLFRQLTTFSSSFLYRQHLPWHFINGSHSIRNVITHAHTLILLIPIKFLGDYLSRHFLDHYITFRLNIL
jgi:hypothetical protein